MRFSARMVFLDMSFTTAGFFRDQAIIELMNKIVPSKKGVAKLRYVMSPKAVVAGSGECVERPGDKYEIFN